MRILHIVPGLKDPTNGIAVAAKWIAERQSKSEEARSAPVEDGSRSRRGGGSSSAKHEVEVVETRDFVSQNFTLDIRRFDEIWVHSMWLPMTLKACWKVLKSGVPLVRMPHGCMDPVKVRYHLYKKLPFLPVEWWLFHKSSRIVSTEDDEDRWISNWHTGTAIERQDLFGDVKFSPRPGLGRRKFLFVGRMHPLKGVDVLMAAVRTLKDKGRLPADFSLTIIGKDEKGMRSRLEGEAKQHGLPVRFLGEVSEEVKHREMATADCFVLPTLSENFGLVVREALECGVPVITTDGAKYWARKPGVLYLDNYVKAECSMRVEMLKEAFLQKFGRSIRSKRVALVLPWVGKLPRYWSGWRKSAADRNFDVLVIRKSIEEFTRLITDRLFVSGQLKLLASTFALPSGYKLCDFKPMYGILFAEELKEYDYWAFGDCDVMYGREFDQWLDKVIASECEVATVQQNYTAGPFTLIKNCEKCNRLYEKATDLIEILSQPRTVGFDELGEDWFGKWRYEHRSYESIRGEQSSFGAICWRERDAGRLRLFSEDVVCEELLGRGEKVIYHPDGALTIGSREIPMYHYNNIKCRFGFSGGGVIPFMCQGVCSFGLAWCVLVWHG